AIGVVTPEELVADSRVGFLEAIRIENERDSVEREAPRVHEGDLSAPGDRPRRDVEVDVHAVRDLGRLLRARFSSEPDERGRGESEKSSATASQASSGGVGVYSAPLPSASASWLVDERFELGARLRRRRHAELFTESVRSSELSCRAFEQ